LAPTRGAGSGEEQLEIDWLAYATTDLDVDSGLRQDGGREIISYELIYDQGTTYLYNDDGLTPEAVVWSTLKGGNAFGDETFPDDMEIEYLLSDVEPGTFYQFKVRAKNIHGWGEWSEFVSIRAADAPDKPPTVRTTIDEATGGIWITWDKMPELHDGSDPIQIYSIEIL